MYRITINGQEGYEKPFLVKSDWKIGELIGSLMPTFDEKINVTVERINDKKGETDG